MWNVDPTGEFIFSLSDRQMSIGSQPEVNVKKLLVNKFAGRRGVRGAAIKSFVEFETDYLNKHKTAALKSLEAESALTVNEKKTDGSARRKNTYPDTCVVNFR